MSNEASSQIEPEARAFAEQLSGLLDAHKGKYAVVKGGKVEGIYDNFHAAYRAGVEKFGLEPFFVGHIVPHEREEQLPALMHGVIHAYL